MTEEIGRQLIFLSWKKSELLQWNDFTGTPEDPDQKAWTYTEIQYRYTFKFVGTFPNLGFKFKKIHVGAFFNQTRSWVKPEFLTQDNADQILKHEQGHFDFAEEHRRKIAQAFLEKTLGKIFPCQGNSELEQRNYAHNNANVILQPIYDEICAKWHQDEGDYDPITNHGQDPVEQKKYDQRFDRLRE